MADPDNYNKKLNLGVIWVGFFMGFLMLGRIIYDSLTR